MQGFSGKQLNCLGIEGMYLPRVTKTGGQDNFLLSFVVDEVINAKAEK